MRTILFAAIAAVPAFLSAASSEVVNALTITSTGSAVTISPGTCRIDGKEVQVTAPTTFDIKPTSPETISDERYILTDEAPVKWAKGTHLKALYAGGTAVPDSLVSGSVIVKTTDGKLLAEGRDYQIDNRWAALARLPNGSIAPKQEVLISYKKGLQRLDAVIVGPDGKVALLQGKPALTCPPLPQAPAGSMHLANIYVLANTQTIEPWQILPVGPAFAEPDAAEETSRSAYVKRTLDKLRAGEPVTIVTWGDSVTCGGDASSTATAYANLFISRLRERFPKSQIKHINAGIGGTNTIQRLVGLTTDVLSHKPDLVTIEFVNDMGFPEDVIRKNYASIFKQIRDANADILLITPHFTMPEMMRCPHPRGPETRETVQLLRKVAEENQVGVADTSRRWAHLEAEGIPYGVLLVNGINHPNDYGHELFVKDLLTFFPAK